MATIPAYAGTSLGSTSVLQKSGDTQHLAGSLARYRPFGSYRTAPTQTITDRDFTGQRENRELGLLYYQARYYLPGVGRFISADTIVPNPANPQSYNRYTYVENRPGSLVDPSGHCAETGDDGCWTWYDRTMQLCPECREFGWEQYGTNFQKEQYYAVKDGWHYTPPEPKNPLFKAPDAVAINISAGGSAAVHGNIGVEWVFNLHSREFTTFVVVGGGGSVGASGSVNVSGVAIYNLGDDNYAYRGSFVDANGTVALGPGVTGGHAWVPTQYDEGARSYYAGISAGAGASGSLSYSEYIPIHTVDLDSLTVEYHIVPYAQELVFDRILGLK